LLVKRCELRIVNASAKGRGCCMFLRIENTFSVNAIFRPYPVHTGHCYTGFY